MKSLRIASVLSIAALAAGGSRVALAAPFSAKTKPTPVSAAAPMPTTAPLSETQRILQVLNRLGYGPRPGDVARVKQKGLAAYLNQQLAPEDQDDRAVEAKLAALPTLRQGQTALSSGYDRWQKEASRLERLSKALRTALAEKDKTKTGTVTLAPAAAPMMNRMEDNSDEESMASMTSVAAMAPAAMSTTGDAPLPATAERLSAAASRVDRTTQEAELQRYQQEAQRARREADKTFNAANAQLAAARIIRAVESERQLQEVLVDFWSNHFNIDRHKGDSRYYLLSYDRDTIRPFVLGRFRDLLGATAKSPAMLIYLDNAQSSAPPIVRPGRPLPRGGLNENYAREIMELHTLGVDSSGGGYTQKDVTEVARCLTGWTVDRPSGTFRFDARRHDTGAKVVLGQRIAAGGGIEDGEAVLDLLASRPATMRHVSYQLCQRLVADEPPAALVDKCVETWERTGGNLRSVVRTIVTSPEFYAPAAYKSKYKSPLEFVVSAIRAQNGTISLLGARESRSPADPSERAKPVLNQVSLLGQGFYQFQAPIGYPEDSRKWRSAGSVIGRLNAALGLSTGRVGGVLLPAPETLAGGEVAGPDTPLVERLISACVNNDLSPRTRAALLRQFGENASDAPKTPQEKRREAQQIMTLLIGSPDFQNR
ncbi:MAG: DUF1800 family protein [Cytophagales bacterium]|nr:DUF1800 family protein [Armatimonadota bacterium]